MTPPLPRWLAVVRFSPFVALAAVSSAIVGSHVGWW